MTGYTGTMIEKEQNFPQFVWTCARAFGVLMEMRDDPMLAPIPKELTPNQYHKEHSAEARKELARLERMTACEQNEFGAKIISDQLAFWKADQAKDDTVNDKFRGMLARVRDWQPPSDEHFGLKKFMIEQLETSIEKPSSYRDEITSKYQAMKPVDAYREQLQKAKDDIVYHDEHYADEVRRTESRNQWLRQLQASVPLPTKLANK